MTEVEYLDADILIEINRVHGGPSAAPLDRAGIEAAAARAWSGFAGIEVFPTLWLKAASLLHGLATTQYFADGNKRTAWLAAVTFLRLNDEDLDVIPTDDAESFVLSVVRHELDVHEVAGWLLEHAAPLVAELDDHGSCLMCGRVGPLPGAELLFRPHLRVLGVRTTGDVMQEWGPDGLHDFGASRFRIERDLVAGVCGRCRYGWMKLLGNQFDTAQATLLRDPAPAYIDRNVARITGAWAVRASLLRSSLDPVTPRSFIRREGRHLSERGRPRPGWSVYFARLNATALHPGRVTTAVSEDDDMTLLQHTWSTLDLAFVCIFDEQQQRTGQDVAAELMAADRSEGRTFARVWPHTSGPVDLDHAWVTAEDLQITERALRTAIY